MNLRFLFLLLAIFSSHLLVATNSVLEQLDANNDHGFWLENNFDTKLASDWDFRFHTEFRWGSDYRKFYYQEYTLIFQNDLRRVLCIPKESALKKISIGPGLNTSYQLQKNTLGHFRWVYVVKPNIEANLDFEMNKWQIKQRMRGEFHFYCRSHYENYNLYRHRLTIYVPYKFTSWKVNPYLSNEWFFRKNTLHGSSGIVGGYYQNRFRVGADMQPFSEKVTHSLYWQWRLSKHRPGTHPRWFNNYMIGFATTAKF